MRTGPWRLLNHSDPGPLTINLPCPYAFIESSYVNIRSLRYQPAVLNLAHFNPLSSKISAHANSKHDHLDRQLPPQWKYMGTCAHHRLCQSG